MLKALTTRMVLVHKRHIVLYSWIAGVLLVALGGSLLMLAQYLSLMHQRTFQEQAVATTTPTQLSSFQFELATTTAKQEQGLGNRSYIPPHYGMLFVFPKDDTYGFWMKDMKVPIDMLWLSDSGRVVYALTNVSTSTYPNVFYPSLPARYVLETAAGESVKQGWVLGARVPLPLPYGR